MADRRPYNPFVDVEAPDLIDPAYVQELVQKNLADGPTAADTSPNAGGDVTDLIRTSTISIQTPTNDARESLIPASTDISGQRFLEPPESPESMYKLYTLSAFWEPIIEALNTNVYKSPHTYDPVIDFAREDEAKKTIRDALLQQKASYGFALTEALEEPAEDEIDKLFEMLKQRARLEKLFLERFFKAAVPDMTYRQLWELTGQDLEVTGNGYWEVIRDTAGRIARFQWLPSISMRATPQDQNQISVWQQVKASAIEYKREVQIKRFRRYAQVHSLAGTQNIAVWFKEFGDPRFLSRTSGAYYPTYEALVAAEQQEGQPAPLPATEVFHWKILYGANTVYGKPRASGLYPDLMGSRDLAEENQRIVSDDDVPSLLMLVSGGVVGTKSFNRFEEQLKGRAKGRKGILLMEAIAARQSSLVAPQQQPKIDVERLKSEQQTDMLFINYDKRNEDKLEGAYRFPKAALGRDQNLNRAVAVAMQRYTEDQVYDPKRDDRDEPINERILPELGIMLWRIRTLPQQTNDPVTIAEVTRILVEAAVITPNEARELTGQAVFNKKLEDLHGLWTNVPPRIVTVMLQTKNKELGAALLSDDDDALEELVKSMADAASTATEEADQTNLKQRLDGGQPARKQDPITGGPGPIQDGGVG